MDDRTRQPLLPHHCPTARRFCLGVVTMLIVASGCRSQESPKPVSTAAPQHGHALEASTPPQRATTTVATVNGRPIARRRVIDLLLRAHGPGLLEQLIVLEAAIEKAGALGLTVRQQDVATERERSLRMLVDPLASVTGVHLEGDAAQEVLDRVLSQRNISAAEYTIGIRRNAYLRKIVSTTLVCSHDQIKAEFDRLYDRRVVVRHIQLASVAEVARCRERLVRGESFAEVARQYSANLASAQNGGLLDPFSREDASVPEAFRHGAFGAKPGVVSDAVPVGRWLHLILVEDVVPALSTDFTAHRDEVERKLRDRLALPAMRELHSSLFDEARVEISDPLLRAAFFEKHPDRVMGR